MRVKIDLPRTTKKLKIVIEKEQDETVKATTDENITKSKTITKTGAVKPTTISKYTAGANYLLTKSKYFRSLVHFGLRIDMPLNPSTKLNLQKDINAEYFDIGLFQKFILYRQEGFQEISQFLVSRKWNETFQTDLLNSLVWTDESDEFVLRNSFILYQRVGDEKGFSYSAGANAKFSPTFYYDSYDASASYRQLLYDKWLYGSLTLGVDFPKANGFKNEKFVQVRLEVFFK
ncbi:MAG: hypothetical protein WC635_11845 [Bacteriovorax sp.]